MSFRTPIQRIGNPIFFMAGFFLIVAAIVGIIILFLTIGFVIPALVGFGIWWILDWAGSPYAFEIAVGSTVLLFAVGMLTGSGLRVERR
jgi:ABC-type multidrug transport system permease subunit